MWNDSNTAIGMVSRARRNHCAVESFPLSDFTEVPCEFAENESKNYTRRKCKNCGRVQYKIQGIWI